MNRTLSEQIAERPDIKTRAGHDWLLTNLFAELEAVEAHKNEHDVDAIRYMIEILRRYEGQKVVVFVADEPFNILE